MLKSNRAQTIMELTIAVGILVVVAGLATMVTARVYKSYEVIKAENEARKTIEETLYSIAYGDDEGLIDAKSIYTNATYSHTQINSGNLIFIEENNNHYIRYYYDTTNSTFHRKEYNDLGRLEPTDNPNSSIDLDITGSVDFFPAVTFEYFKNTDLDSPGDDEDEITSVTSANVNQITRVKIEITVRVPGAGDYRTLTVHTSIRPLNLYNL